MYYSSEVEIKLINNILEEAVKHGGDVGGKYPDFNGWCDFKIVERR